MSSGVSLEVNPGRDRTYLRVRRVAWPPVGMTVEVMRLLILDEHERWLTLLGLQVEDLAAWRYFDAGTPGSTCWVADDGRRLVGFLSLVPCAPASAGRPSSTLARPLIVASNAPEGTWGALLRAACSGHLERGGHLVVPVPTANLRAADALTEWGFKPAGGIASVLSGSRVKGVPSSFDQRFEHLRLRFFRGRAGSDPADDGLDGPRRADQPEASTGELCTVGLGVRQRSFDGADVLAVVEPGGEVVALIGYRRVSPLYAVSGYALARVDAIAICRAWIERGLIRWLANQLRAHLARRGVDGALIEFSLGGGLAPRLLREFGQAGFKVCAMHQLLCFGHSARTRNAVALEAPAPAGRGPLPAIFEEGRA